MENTNLQVSKAPLVVSIVFTSINTILMTLYIWMSIVALPIAFNPNRGTEGIGLAIALIFMFIFGIAVFIFSSVSIPTALFYNKKSNGNFFAKILAIINISFAIISAITLAVVVIATKS